MEWNNGAGGSPVNKPAHSGRKKLSLMNLRTASVGLVICIAILIAAIAGYVALGGNSSEGSFVDKSKMQAVFLNGGQVYFGKITDLNNKFLRVSDIYYLRVNQTVQPNQQSATDQQTTNSNDISLVKLGCELHGPQDNMVINQEQVIFWENLKDDGQVAKAVATYKQQNPNGQKCDTTNTSGGTTNGTTNDTTNNNTTKTPTTNNNTTNNSTNR
jgi:hypothetical protein